jgi:hypothetical protein
MGAVQTAAFGAERKLIFEINGFRSCPVPAIDRRHPDSSGGVSSLIPAQNRREPGLALLTCGAEVLQPAVAPASCSVTLGEAKRMLLALKASIKRWRAFRCR